MAVTPVTVLPVAATSGEVEEILEVFKKAFGPDPLIEFVFNRPNVSPEPKETTVAKHLERLADPKFFYHKAVDSENPNGPILGVAGWYWVENPLTSSQNIPWGDPSPGTHMECYEASLGALRRWRVSHFRELGEPFLYMGILTVVPGMQRRGVGSALLRKGLAEADRRGVQTFIEASPAGLGLYKKFGWEETIKTVVNLKDYGGEDIQCVTVGLVRPAYAQEAV